MRIGLNIVDPFDLFSFKKILFFYNESKGENVGGLIKELDSFLPQFLKSKDVEIKITSISYNFFHLPEFYPVAQVIESEKSIEVYFTFTQKKEEEAADTKVKKRDQGTHEMATAKTSSCFFQREETRKKPLKEPQTNKQVTHEYGKKIIAKNTTKKEELAIESSSSSEDEVEVSRIARKKKNRFEIVDESDSDDSEEVKEANKRKQEVTNQKKNTMKEENLKVKAVESKKNANRQPEWNPKSHQKLVKEKESSQYAKPDSKLMNCETTKLLENKNRFYGSSSSLSKPKSSLIKPITESSVDINKLESIEQHYKLIPSYKTESVEFLKATYPELFIRNTRICFKVYELDEIRGCPSISSYKKGYIQEFVPVSCSLLVKLEDGTENTTNLLDEYACSEENYANCLISIELKNIIELRIEKGDVVQNNSQNTTSSIAFDDNNANKQANQSEVIPPSQVSEAGFNNLSNSDVNLKTSTSTNVNETATVNNVNTQPDTSNEQTTKKLSSLPKKDVFKRFTYPVIKRQVEFYFSDKNYYKDSFLLNEAKLNKDNYIRVDIILSFNKIKTITENRQDFIDAVVGSEIVEFNNDFSMIRKKKIIFTNNGNGKGEEKNWLDKSKNGDVEKDHKEEEN